MNRSERACQLWAILAIAASHRQLLSYSEVAKATGLATQGVGQMLEPIQSYCLVNDLPPLTALVVSSQTGQPGAGFVATDATVYPQSLQSVFKQDWLTYGNPGVEAFEVAVRERPSNGIV